VPFALNVPITNGNNLTFTLEAGQTLFVLGANGTGKSTLIQRLYASHHSNARRISAHRQSWFDPNSLTFSGQQKRTTEQNISQYDVHPNSRWMDQYPSQRAAIAIYELIDAENVRARGIASAVDSENIESAKQLAKIDAPIKLINELLRLSNLPITISVRESEQILASKSGGTQYNISELSDGERNVLLIAANVLTAKAGTILFVDEPERHLHRSIISPLLSNLFEHRKDCAFVVSTHEVMLPIDNPTARTLLLRGCCYSGNTVGTWDADLVASEYAIDDDLKRDILGGRRKLLFVEGDEHSLDKPIYSLIFPSVSVIAKDTCRDVEHAVSGIRDAAELHWLHACGIVDNDRRTPDDIDKMRAKGVYALPVFSVESLYYNMEIQKRIAQRANALTGADPDELVNNARAAAVAAVKSHVQRLSERAVEATLRQDLMHQLPRRQDIAAAQPINITIDVPMVVAAEAARLQKWCDYADLPSIIAHYPVRETAALTSIAKCLGFQNQTQYESAVRKLLMDDREALAFVQGLFEGLADELAT
jgi:ABC-type cobalamin/Fe3+-siderophores transport system ATPase subunit